MLGVITNVSESYSLGFSVLNKRWGASAKLKKSGTFGPLSWDGTDYRFANLNGIPFHVELAVGDTVVTSSYSSVFPEGYYDWNHSFIRTTIRVKIIIRYSVKLAVDFRALSFVDVIDNLKNEEIKKLGKYNSRMIRILIKYAIMFIVTGFSAGLILNQIQFSGFFNPYIYILFIIVTSLEYATVCLF